MFITLQQLERDPIHFHLEIGLGEIEFGSNITQVTALESTGEAVLLNQALGEIRVRGSVSVIMSAACDRCLEAVSLPVESKFDLVYMPAGETSGGEDEVDESGIEVDFYDGPGLELNNILREVVLLALPMQVVCDEGCKGICPVCGQNRNGHSCDCRTGTTDDRWNKLRDFRPRPA